MRRLRLNIRSAEIEVEETRWQCETCTGPADEDSTFCLYCRSYWEDCKNGLWADPAGREALRKEGGE